MLHRSFWRFIILSVSLVLLTILLPATTLAHTAKSIPGSVSSTVSTIPPLGGVDLDGYCKSLGDQGASLDGSTAYDWRCVTPSGDHVGLSVLAACQWQYNNVNAIDVFLDFNNPQSWKCYAGIDNLSSPNLNGYCQSLGDQGASLDGNTAYDWRCVTPSGDHVQFSVWDACSWQYSALRVARVANFYDAYSWQCWKASYVLTSSKWAGYISTGFSGNPVTFSHIQGTWVVPKASCSQKENSSSAFWIGLGGTHGDLEQVATVTSCSNGHAQYGVYYEIVTGPLSKAQPINKPVQPNDTIHADVDYLGDSSGSFLLDITDSTQGWNFNKTFGVTTAITARDSAECIAEAPTAAFTVQPLTNFGAVSFSDCAVNNNLAAITASPVSILMVMVTSDGTEKARPTGLTSGKVFSVTWKHQ